MFYPWHPYGSPETTMRILVRPGILTMQDTELEYYIQDHFRGMLRRDVNSAMIEQWKKDKQKYFSTLIDGTTKEDMRHPNILTLLGHPAVKPAFDYYLSNL